MLLEDTLPYFPPRVSRFNRQLGQSNSSLFLQDLHGRSGRRKDQGQKEGVHNSLFSPLERVTWDSWYASWRSCSQSSWTKRSAGGGEGVGGKKRKGAVFYLMSVAAPSHQCLAHGEYSETGPSTKTDGKFHHEFSLSSSHAPLDHSHWCPSLCTSRGN